MPTTLSPLAEATLVACVAAEETDGYPMIASWAADLVERNEGMASATHEFPFLVREHLVRVVGRVAGAKLYRPTWKGIVCVRELGATKFDLPVTHGCEDGKCGGWFWCPGCERVVGYCMGAHDEYPEHCDDCAAALVEIAGAAQ